MKNAVLDLAIIIHDYNFENCTIENIDVKLIELNPFGKSSSAALFSWVEDR